MVGEYQEKWFFECKRYEKGVPPEQINSKIAWADAEKPKHLVIITSSYLSNNARTWLDKISPDKPYSIHLVEGIQLKNLILGFQDLIEKYFLDYYTKLLHEARNSWLIHDLLPAPETICLLVKNIDEGKLSREELAFLWSSAKVQSEEIENWILDNEPFYLDPFFHALASFNNTADPVISLDDDISTVRFLTGINDFLGTLVLRVHCD